MFKTIRNAWGIPDLRRKILFTILIVIFFRIGSVIPVPFLDIEALKNLETPKYFALIKRDLLTKWNGLVVKKAAAQEVDVITGATYSSESVIENVKRGLDYYNKKK